jgi:hypothetical protein
MIDVSGEDASVRTARRVVFVLLGLYAVFLTYPGMVPFNRIRPLVLGLPFVMFWIVLWIVLVMAGFALLNAVETRAARRAAGPAAATAMPEQSHGTNGS